MKKLLTLAIWALLALPANAQLLRSSPPYSGNSRPLTLPVGQFDEYNVTLTASTPIVFSIPTTPPGTQQFRVNTCQNAAGGWTPTFTTTGTLTIVNRVGAAVTTLTALACDTEYWTFRALTGQLVLESVSFNTGGVAAGGITGAAIAPASVTATGSIGASNFTSTQFPYSDNFTRADSAPGAITAAPTGQTYQVSGADVAFVQIQNNQVRDLNTGSNAVAYFGPGLITGNVTQIGAQVTFYAQTGGSGTPSMTLIASEDSTISLVHMVHTIVNTTPVTTWWSGASQVQPPSGGCQTDYGPNNAGAAQTGGNALSAFVAGETLTAIKSLINNTQHLYVYTSTGEWYTEDCTTAGTDVPFSTLWGAGVATFPIMEFSRGATLAPGFTQGWVQTSNGTVTLSNPSGGAILGNSNVQLPAGLDNTTIGANIPSKGFFQSLGVGTQIIPNRTSAVFANPSTSSTTGPNVVIDNSGSGGARGVLMFQSTDSGANEGGLAFRKTTTGASTADMFVDTANVFNWNTNATLRMQAGQTSGSGAGFIFRLVPETIAPGASGLAACQVGIAGSLAIVKDSDAACSFGVAPTHTSCVVGTSCYGCLVACVESNGVYGWAAF